MQAATETSAAPLAVRIWVLVCALLSAAGWLLSLLGHLDVAGYAGALTFTTIIVLFVIRQEPIRRVYLPRLRRRFTRGFPRAFLVLALLALIGGFLYPPSNFDALACRTARVLHWLDEGRWHWIRTDLRGALNTRTCGFEWLTAPVLLFFHSDRWLFLLNGLCYLLLPGLVFSVFRRLGLGGRLAWHWMWLFPAGFCFVLQAGSLANDLFGATLALAAIDFALRARSAAHPGSPLRYSFLAAALMTAAKISNLTLLLPWCIAIIPGLLRWAGIIEERPEQCSRKPEPLLAKPSCSSSLIEWGLNLIVVATAVLASFIPTAFLNYRQTRDWTGITTEEAWLRPPGRVVCFVHNMVLLTEQNLAPPVFPFASAWERFLERRIPEQWQTTLDRFAEDGRKSYRLRELPIEEHAGMGSGLALIALSAFVFALFGRRSGVFHFKDTSHVSPYTKECWERLWRGALLVSPLISLVAFMMKSGLVAASRVIAPDYALLLPMVLWFSRRGSVVRMRWWRAFAGLAFAFAFIALLLTPARPLFPAKHLFEWLQRHHPSPQVERAALAYSVYRERWDVFAPFRQVLPSTAKVIGAVTAWGPETCLWRPLGERRVVHIRGDLSLQNARQRGIEYVVVETSSAAGILGQPLAEWMSKMKAVELGRFSIRLLVNQPASEFAVVRLGAAVESLARQPATGDVAQMVESIAP